MMSRVPDRRVSALGGEGLLTARSDTCFTHAPPVSAEASFALHLSAHVLYLERGDHAQQKGLFSSTLQNWQRYALHRLHKPAHEEGCIESHLPSTVPERQLVASFVFSCFFFILNISLPLSSSFASKRWCKLGLKQRATISRGHR